jgi:hypothetical protein
MREFLAGVPADEYLMFIRYHFSVKALLLILRDLTGAGFVFLFLKCICTAARKYNEQEALRGIHLIDFPKHDSR